MPRYRPRRTGCATALAVAVLGLAGCGSTEEPVAEAEAAPEYSGWCAENHPPTFTGEAVDKYGEDATTAYCAMADFTMNVASWNPTLMAHSGDLEEADVAFLKPYMTPTLQDSIDGWLQQANQEDEVVDGSVSSYLLTLFYTGLTGTDGAPATWPADNAEVVTGKQLTEPTLALDVADDGTERLAVTLTAAGVVHPTLDGVPYTWTSEKTITYRLVPDARPHTWLIDSFGGKWHGSGVVDEHSG